MFWHTVENVLKVCEEGKVEHSEFLKVLRDSTDIPEDVTELVKELIKRNDIENLTTVFYAFTAVDTYRLSEVLDSETYEAAINLFHEHHEDSEFVTMVMFSNAKLSEADNDVNQVLDYDMIQYLADKYSSDTIIQRYEDALAELDVK